SRPCAPLTLMRTGIDVSDTLPNGEYRTGYSTVVYQVVTQYNPKNKFTAYETTIDDEYGANGQAFISTYSPWHAKVNDIVIHNPVSVENAMIISLPDELDQRTDASKALGGNKNEGLTEYERVLDPNYRQNIIPNPA